MPLRAAGAGESGRGRWIGALQRRRRVTVTGDQEEAMAGNGDGECRLAAISLLIALSPFCPCPLPLCLVPAPAVDTSQWHYVDVSRYTACSHKACILPPYRSSRKPLERGTSLLHYMVRTSGTLVTCQFTI